MRKIYLYFGVLFMFANFFAADVNAQYITFMVKNSTQTYVSAINDSNFIAGYFEDGGGTHGFICNGTDTLVINYPGAVNTYIYGINNHSVVVGAYTSTGNMVDLEGFSYNRKTGVYTDLTSGWLSTMDNTIARDINDAGCIIGDYKQSTTHVAFSMCGGTNEPFHYNYNPTYVYGINSAGSVVGLWIDGSNRKGLIKHGANWTEINYPGFTRTNPTAINDSNVVVGVYDLNKSFIYKNGTFKQLTKHGATDFQVRDINNYGSICGYFKDASGVYKGFYLPKWDIVFRPNPNGWKFGNSSANIWPSSWYNKFKYENDPYAGGSSAFPTKTRNPLTYFESKLFPDWPLFVDVFGEEACYKNAGGPYRVFRGAAVLKWKKASKDWGGSCFGFVISSFMVWDSIEQFKDFFPKTGPWNSSKLYDLPLNDNNRRSINYLMVSQYRKQLLTYYTTLWSEGPGITLKKTKIMMNDTLSKDYRGLAMWNTNGPGGHIVNPYKILIDTLNQNLEYIYVYDNNMPNDTTRKITINKATNKWYYNVSPNVNAPASQWGGNNANYGLLLCWPSSHFYSKPVLDSLWAKTNFIEIFPTQTSSAVITAAGGDSIGFLNGKVINNTVDGQPMYHFNSNDPIPYGYIVADKPYKILLQNYLEPYLDLSVFNNDKVFSYSRNNGTLAEKDIINIGTHFSVNNPDNSLRLFNLETFNSDASMEMTIYIGDIGLSAGGSISFRWINDKLEVVNQGQATTYDLDIRYISDNGEFNFAHDDISFAANTTHIISPDWNNLQSQDVTVFIDNGNNGVNEDTLYFGNEKAPQILTSEYYFDYTEVSYTDTIHITNTGGGSLNWSALSSAPSWLSITSGNSGVNNGMIIFNVSANSGAARNAEISITATGAVNSPFKIIVNQTGVINVPVNVDASDGQHFDGVHINWDQVSGATHYKIFRSDDAGSIGTAITGWSSALSYIDVTAVEGQYYYYSVKAAQSASGTNESGFSNSDDGWRPCFTADFNFDNACAGQAVLFNETGNAHMQVWYLWDIGDDGTIDYTGNSFSKVFNVPGNVDVRLYITDSLLCSRSIMKQIDIKPFPVLNLPSDTTLCSWQSLTLNAGSGFNSYFWSDGSSSSSINVSYPNYSVGANFIYLQVTNTNGCSVIDTTVVTFNYCASLPVFEEDKFFMNVFPNPANGVVNVEVSGLTGLTELKVFNLNGQIVYNTNINSIENNWTSSFDLTGMPGGIYFIRLVNKDKVDVRKLIVY